MAFTDGHTYFLVFQRWSVLINVKMGDYSQRRFSSHKIKWQKKSKIERCAVSKKYLESKQYYFRIKKIDEVMKGNV